MPISINFFISCIQKGDTRFIDPIIWDISGSFELSELPDIRFNLYIPFPIITYTWDLPLARSCKPSRIEILHKNVDQFRTRDCFVISRWISHQEYRVHWPIMCKHLDTNRWVGFRVWPKLQDTFWLRDLVRVLT